MIMVVIITAAIISIVVIKTSLSSVTQLLYTNTSLESSESTLLTESCLQEGLINLNRDNEYSGETLNILSGQCNITVTDNAPNKTITVSSQINNFYQEASAEVSLDPFTLVTWDN